LRASAPRGRRRDGGVAGAVVEAQLRKVAMR
jgi:hypothetical protein